MELETPTTREAVISAIRDFVATNPSAEFQFGHIVFSDHNLDDGAIVFSLEYCFTEGYIQDVKSHKWSYPISDTEIQRCSQFLQWLLTIPEDVRCEDDEVEEL